MKSLRTLLPLVLPLLLLALAACGPDASGIAGFKSIRVQQAAELIKSRPELQIVDVRTKGELAQGMIAGARHVGLRRIMDGEHALDPAKPLLLVCAVGGRSFSAGVALAGKGFKEVYNMEGGMSAW